MDKTVAIKRRTYFIEKEFQAKFILKFCSLLVFGSILIIGLLYLILNKSTTVSFVNSRVVVRTTADFILPILVQTLVVVTAIVSLATVAVTLFASHKIAGPLYRFKKVIEALSEGNFSYDFKIRHLDQLQDLAGTLNNMIVKIRGQLNALKSSSALLKNKLDSIPENEVAEHSRSSFKELKRLSVELDKIICYFKS